MAPRPSASQRRARTLTPALLPPLILPLLGPAWGVAAELSVTISDVRDRSGTLRVQVLPSKAAYAGEEAAVLSLLLPPNGERVRFSTDALSAGHYAVRVMHDSNGNGKLDSTAIGRPKEPWGFSNNATGRFGPPDWEAIRFELKDDIELEIRLNH